MLTLKDGMSDCSQLPADWDKIKAMSTIFSSLPGFVVHVGKDILLNGVDIYHEIEAAIADYESQKWEDFGYQIGQASAKVFIGVSTEDVSVTESQMEAIAVGFFRGALDA